MAHLATRSSYGSLAERLNRFPQGAPPTDLLFRILKLLFSEREAALVSKLPIKPFTAAKAARIWGTGVDEARRSLDALAGRALLLDVERHGRTQYVLPPPMAGFFEFSMMRVRQDVDQKALAELFYQYLNVEEDFVRALFTGGQTQVGRAFVNEEALQAGDGAVTVLDFERASVMIREAGDVGVGTCYCRHKMEHLGRACSAPMRICMTLGTTATSLIRHGFAERVPATRALELLHEARARSLVQFGENVQKSPSFICNCCGCCCEAMIAQRRFALLRPIHTTAFLPELDPARCNGCGLCASACPVEAMTLVSANDPQRPKKKTARLAPERCLGCGVCVPACRAGAVRLAPRPERTLTPVDTVHRVVLMAVERGKLQDLIFDNRALASHRAMAAVLGAVLRLPPLKRALAGRQMRSRYVETLLARHAAKATAPS